jgi:hypothetical protein
MHDDRRSSMVDTLTAIAVKNRNAIFFVMVQILLLVVAVLGGMPVTPL